MIEEIDRLKRDNLKAWKLVEELEKDNTALTIARKGDYKIIDEMKESLNDKIYSQLAREKKSKKLQEDFDYLKTLIKSKIIAESGIEKFTTILSKSLRLQEQNKISILEGALKERNEVIKNKNVVINDLQQSIIEYKKIIKQKFTV